MPAASTPPPDLSLADLEPGAEARVEAVESGTPFGRRLADLGFLPGTPVRVLRRAPLGDPVEYELRGTRLCLRRSEAQRIRVRHGAPGEAPHVAPGEAPR